jgi:DnaA family protein
LYVSAKSSPASLNIKLADLISRLNWGPVYQLQVLEDADKVQAMQQRADQRGFELPDEVANYLLSRYPRDLHSLFALLDRLDFASLQAQRRLTIPFVKSHLAES